MQPTQSHRTGASSPSLALPLQGPRHFLRLHAYLHPSSPQLAKTSYLPLEGCLNLSQNHHLDCLSYSKPLVTFEYVENNSRSLVPHLGEACAPQMPIGPSTRMPLCCSVLGFSYWPPVSPRVSSGSQNLAGSPEPSPVPGCYPNECTSPTTVWNVFFQNLQGETLTLDMMGVLFCFLRWE